MNTALDAIERRIDQLNRIVGAPSNGSAAHEDASAAATSATAGGSAAPAAGNAVAAPASSGRAPVETLTDSLASAHTLIASAMAGRPTIADIVQRSAELEHMLDPAYLDAQQEAKAKEVYVNTVAPELAATFEQLEQIKRLEPALGAEYFRSIPDVSGSLQTITDATTELGQRNDLLEESLTIALQRYDEVQSGINRSLQELNERIDQVEAKLRTKCERQRDEKETAAAAAAAAADAEV